MAQNNEEITKQGVPSTNVKKTLLSEAPIEHDVANHGRQINGNSTKDDFRVKLSRTWKVPKYSKKQPRLDHEHPAFSLDYMQPSTHPPHHN
ncbi:hypothetical protein Bca52824_047636 [Brassica carinata]|uniref:Uncharacterized protein n=1 Tax=Brassica carinata TaxID=52824 RepID=A0A8X7URG3_BRACI|nr:hypothetical protein Bca52824_047636 [Brassica carinata]